MGHDVFISHSSQDKAAADAVCAALEANGIRCWIAPRDIVPGENWASSILKGIAECRMMVLVFSAQTNSSQHIRREVERAVHHGIPIAPIRIQDAMPSNDLEYFLSSSHWMDALTPPFEQHLRGLASQTRSLLEMLGNTPAPAPNLAAAPALGAAATASAPRPGAGYARRRSKLVPVLLLLVVAGGGAAGWGYRDKVVRTCHKILAAWSGETAPVVPPTPPPQPPSPRVIAELARDQASSAQKQWEEFLPSKVDPPQEAIRAAATLSHAVELYNNGQYPEAKIAWDDAHQQYLSVLELGRGAEMACAKSRSAMAAWEGFDSPPHLHPPAQVAQAKAAMSGAARQQAAGDYTAATAAYQQAGQLFASAKETVVADDEAARDQASQLQGRADMLNQQLNGIDRDLDTRLQKAQSLNDQNEQALLQQLKKLVDDHMRDSPEQADAVAQLKLAMDAQRDKHYAEALAALQTATEKLQQRVDWPKLVETVLREEAAAQAADPKLGPHASELPLVKEQRDRAQQWLIEADQDLSKGDLGKATDLCAKAKKAFELVPEKAKKGLLLAANNKVNTQHAREAAEYSKELSDLDPQNPDAKALQSRIDVVLASTSGNAQANGSGTPKPPPPQATNPPPPTPPDPLTILNGLDPNAKNASEHASISLKVGEAAALAKIKDVLAQKSIDAQATVDNAKHTIVAEETNSIKMKSGGPVVTGKVEYCIFVRRGNDQSCQMFYKVVVYHVYHVSGREEVKWDSDSATEKTFAEAFKKAVEAGVKP